MNPGSFFVAAYETERLKTLSVWSCFGDGDLRFRPALSGASPIPPTIGQLTVYLRLLGRPVYSTYGPSADTGGLFQNHAPTIYRYASLEDLLESEEAGGRWRPLPGPGTAPPTERP